MARVYADYRRSRRKELVDLGFQFLGEVLELRSKPRLEPPSRPNELLAQRRQAGADSLFPLDQGRAEEIGPLLDQIPGMPVGEIRPTCRSRDFSCHPDLVQQIEH